MVELAYLQYLFYGNRSININKHGNKIRLKYVKLGGLLI